MLQTTDNRFLSLNMCPCFIPRNTLGSLLSGSSRLKPVSPCCFSWPWPQPLVFPLSSEIPEFIHTHHHHHLKTTSRWCQSGMPTFLGWQVWLWHLFHIFQHHTFQPDDLSICIINKKEAPTQVPYYTPINPPWSLRESWEYSSAAHSCLRVNTHS